MGHARRSTAVIFPVTVRSPRTLSMSRTTREEGGRDPRGHVAHRAARRGRYYRRRWIAAPAVQSAREAARRIRCANNLKQVTLCAPFVRGHLAIASEPAVQTGGASFRRVLVHPASPPPHRAGPALPLREDPRCRATRCKRGRALVPGTRRRFLRRFRCSSAPPTRTAFPRRQPAIATSPNMGPSRVLRG